MMYIKLVLLNLKKSCKDYLIYIMTLILSVGLFYGFYSMSSPQFQKEFPVEYDINNLQSIIRIAVLLIGFIIIFLVRYADRYMLSRKKREFAIYSLVGAEQRMISALFFGQILFMGAVAIGAGVLLGMLLSQFAAAIVLNLYALPYTVRLRLYPDTLLTTVILFLLIFTFAGLENVRTIHRMRIIQMLNSNRKTDADFKARLNVLPWVVLSDIAALYMVGLGSYGFFSGLKQSFDFPILFWLFMGAAVPFLFLLLSAVYYVKLIKKKQCLLWIALLSMAGLAAAICAFIVFRLVGMSDLYPAGSAILLLLSFFGFFDCLSGGVLAVRRRFPRSRYKNLFLFGQITAKLKTNSRTMAVMTLVLIGSTLCLSIAQPIAQSKSEYHRKRIPTDFVVVNHWWLAAVPEDLPDAHLSFQFVDDDLREAGFPVKSSAAVRRFFLNDDDFYRRQHNGAPETDVVLGISLSDYNRLRLMMDYREIALTDGQFAVHWDVTATPGMMSAYEKSTPFMTAGAESLLFSGQSYQDNMGDFICGATSSPLIILPDTVCGGLTVAENHYYGRTSKPLSPDFAVRFSRGSDEKIASERLFPGSSAVRYPYTFTRADQVNESLTWDVMLTLTANYIGLIFLIMCFTVLSLQLLSEGEEHRYRFQVLRNLGVEKAEIHGLMFKQMAFWFGTPLVCALSVSGIVLAMLIRQRFILSYVGLGPALIRMGAAIVVICVLFSCYFAATYLLFKKIADKRQ